MPFNLTSRALRAALALLAALPPSAFGHTDDVRRAEWFLDFLEAERAHAISTGIGVTVALPDTGVNQHRDIQKNLLEGFDFIANSRLKNRNDQIGHGTGLAGLIVGHGHSSGEGILGIAPEAKLIPIKVSNGPGVRPEIAAGIEFAISRRAEVINISSGGASSLELQDSITAAIRADIVVVAASGNDFRAAQMGYPGALPGVLAVGAIGQNGKASTFSIPGPNLGICAPGEDIATTAADLDYEVVRGTSAATAIVSGAAALVRARFPGLSAPEVIHRLTATATDIGAPGWDEQCGYGVLNIVKALTAEVPPVEGGAGPASASGGAGPVGSGKDGGSAGEAGGQARRSGDGRDEMFGVLGGIAAVLAGGVFVGFLAARRRNRKRPDAGVER
jgi:type VII secretion-associated serine protease mycosin